MIEVFCRAGHIYMVELDYPKAKYVPVFGLHFV